MGKRYGPEDIERGLQALAETGGNTTQASENTGIPRGTLRYWAANGFASEFASIRQEKRIDFITEVWETAKEAVRHVRATLGGANAKEAAVIAGIFIDKALLMGGEPTEIAEQRERAIIYLPEPDELSMEAESGAAVAVPSEPSL